MGKQLTAQELYYKTLEVSEAIELTYGSYNDYYLVLTNKDNRINKDELNDIIIKKVSDILDLKLTLDDFDLNEGHIVRIKKEPLYLAGQKYCDKATLDLVSKSVRNKLEELGLYIFVNKKNNIKLAHLNNTGSCDNYYVNYYSFEIKNNEVLVHVHSNSGSRFGNVNICINQSELEAVNMVNKNIIKNLNK